ncbi:MAG: NADP-dependent phosphogluconate dehydrogenase, partial [Alphaproteobacteria bacterium]|nr:NADP-dependent phosphogluconate dehydrogenase [Alphaproteobacteria bacterium]
MGLGVMGANLARNLARNGARLALFDAAAGVAAPLAKDIGDGAVGADDIAGLIAALPAPRSIMLMVPAGHPVDDALEALRPHLGSGDIVIDGGNSFYRDTQRRQIEFARQGVHVLGFGVSGGAE